MLETQANTPEPTETDNQGADTRDPVAMFDELIKKQEAPADVASEQTDDEAEEAPEPEESEEADEAEPDDADEGTEEEEAEPVKIEIKHNGKVIEKTLDEIKDLAQQGFDYSQKMQRVNADREEVSSLRQAVQAKETQLAQQQQTYLESLQIMEKFLSTAGIPDEALDKLLQEGDNDGYLRLKNQKEKDARNLHSIRSAIHAEQENMNERQKAYFAEQKAKGVQVLSEKMPHLLEAKGAQELYAYLASYDYTPDQINSTVDPNLYIMAEKARQYDALMAKAKDKPTPVQKPLPKQLKSKAAPTPADAAKRAQYSKTLERVKSGDRSAAIDAFAMFV